MLDISQYLRGCLFEFSYIRPAVGSLDMKDAPICIEESSNEPSMQFWRGLRHYRGHSQFSFFLSNWHLKHSIQETVDYLALRVNVIGLLAFTYPFTPNFCLYVEKAIEQFGNTSDLFVQGIRNFDLME